MKRKPTITTAETPAAGWPAGSVWARGLMRSLGVPDWADAIDRGDVEFIHSEPIPEVFGPTLRAWVRVAQIRRAGA